jgi:hypothetical protein
MESMKKLLALLLMIGSVPTVFAQTNYATGLAFDEDLNAKILVRKRATNRGGTLPAKVSLKAYCPTPQQQGVYPNCVGWAVGYAACTISEAIIHEALTDKKLNLKAIDAIATSPTYIYAHVKPKEDKTCNSKACMENVMTQLKGNIIPRYQDFKDICLPSDETPKTFTKGVQIEQFTNLFQPSDSKKQKLYAIKQTLANKKPVVIGIWHYKSFEQAKKVWSGNLSKYVGSGHAVCLTGYDDTVEGGAVEVMNSWGTDWGESGFSMIRYKDLDTILKYAFEITLDGCQTAQKNVAPSLIQKKDTILKASIELKFTANATTMPIVLNPNRTAKPFEPHFQTPKPYTSGTKYQAIMDHSEPIYLYVLSSDLTGHVDKLFPANETMSPFLSNPNAPFTLPNEEWYIESDETVGKDYLFFLCTKTELPIDTLVAQWNAMPTPALEKIRKSFPSKIQSFQSLDAIQNKMSFKGKLESDKILLVTVEMKHE